MYIFIYMDIWIYIYEWIKRYKDIWIYRFMDICIISYYIYSWCTDNTSGRVQP